MKAYEWVILVGLVLGVISFVIVAAIDLWKNIGRTECSVHSSQSFVDCQECVDNGGFWYQTTCSSGHCYPNDNGGVYSVPPYRTCKKEMGC